MDKVFYVNRKITAAEVSGYRDDGSEILLNPISKETVVGIFGTNEEALAYLGFPNPDSFFRKEIKGVELTATVFTICKICIGERHW